MAAMALLVFVWCASSLAADKADKIGFINMRQIMQNSNTGKKAAEEFKKFYDNKTREIKSAENELKTLKDELDKQSEIMTQSARSEKESAYQKKMRDYQLLVNDTNEELKRRDQEMTQKIDAGNYENCPFRGRKRKIYSGYRCGKYAGALL